MMIIWVLSILSTVISAFIIHFLIVHYGKTGRIINLIPGIQAIPIAGSMYPFYGSPTENWKQLRKMNSQYYPIFRLWRFTSAVINIRHPDDVEKVVCNPRFNDKSDIYRTLQPWLKNGLLTSSGRKWHSRRKILTPAFHFNMLKRFVHIFVEEANRLIKILKSEGEPVVKDLRQLISEHTLNVICETAMGVSLSDKGEFQYKYRKAVHDMGELVVYRVLRPWFYYDWFFNIFPKGIEQSKALQILHRFTKKIIQERKEYHNQTNYRYLNDFNDDGNGKEDDTVFGIRKKKLAMLDLLIAAQRDNEIDEEGIREEVDTFMFEGHDTIYVSLAYTIMLLAEHPEIQEKARVEVQAIMQETMGKLDVSALQKLSYLERCIKESLRLYPSVHFISRQSETDTELSGYVIPANTVVNVHIIDLHRDPQFWPNPKVFDPDRFLPENSRGRHPYCYIPFSAGSRNCIGQRFAMLELKTTLAFLLHNFILEPVDFLQDDAFIPNVVLQPAQSLRTKFIPLQN